MNRKVVSRKAILCKYWWDQCWNISYMHSHWHLI